MLSNFRAEEYDTEPGHGRRTTQRLIEAGWDSQISLTTKSRQCDEGIAFKTREERCKIRLRRKETLLKEWRRHLEQRSWLLLNEKNEGKRCKYSYAAFGKITQDKTFLSLEKDCSLGKGVNPELDDSTPLL